jgi:ADP-ribose pyrophosphatase
MTSDSAARDDSPRGRTLATRRAYSGRIISLDIDRVSFPDGSVGELEMIRHPGASAVVPFLSPPAELDSEILLIRQYRHAAERFLYEVPAGRLDPGEPPLTCARRELKEETGYTADHVEYLFTMFTTPGFTDERIHVFMASGLVLGETAREADEFMSLETVTLAKALELVRTGGIQDAKTALAILYAARFRTER